MDQKTLLLKFIHTIYHDAGYLYWSSLALVHVVKYKLFK